MASEQIATLRNTRKFGRVAINCAGKTYLEPGEAIDLPVELAMRLVDPSVGTAITHVDGDGTEDKYRARIAEEKRVRTVKPRGGNKDLK